MVAHSSAPAALSSRQAQSAQIYFSICDGRVAGTLILDGEPPREFNDAAQLERLLQIGSGRLALVSLPHGDKTRAPELRPLNDTERTIVEAAAAGSSNHEIAAATCYSIKSVEAYLTRIYRRYQLSGRSDLGRLIDSIEDLAPGSGDAELVAGGGARPGGSSIPGSRPIALSLVIV